LNPVAQYFATAISTSQMSDVVVRTTEPVAFIRRDFELSGIRLSDFEMHTAGVQ